MAMGSCKYKIKKGQSQLGFLADSEQALELPLYAVIANIHEPYLECTESQLPKLFIIDQSLREMGGHHYDYVRLVAEASSSTGMETIIGTHRGLRSDAEGELSEIAEVKKGFRQTTYSELSQLAGLRELVCRKDSMLNSDSKSSNHRINQWRRQFAQRRYEKGRARLIRTFAEDCERFFKATEFNEDDHIFFTTISEIEFLGLAAYLGNHPRTISATWHTQFHFSMLAGRPDEFEKQTENANRLTNTFQSALARAPYHTILAYTTSQELADQYNGMSLLKFESLPYPVNPSLFSGYDSPPSRSTQTPISITVAGGVRREKGQKTKVTEFINAIWEQHIEPGNVRINIQSGKRSIFSPKRVLGNREIDPQRYHAGVQTHRHPLSRPDYVDLIRQSDVGLFCYDSRRYYSRRAGILSEFLACGKPVIVPAGSWLSRQIQAPVCEHIEAALRQADHAENINITDLKWDPSNVPLPGRRISFNRQRNPYHCEFRFVDLAKPAPEALIINFQWQWAADASFVDIELTCFDKDDRLIASDRQIVGTRQNRSDSIAFLKLPADAETGRLSIRNAWGENSITLSNVCLNFISNQNFCTPRSAVGIIAADNTMLARAIDEMVLHYEHYLDSANAFSTAWADLHNPRRTVDRLIPQKTQLRYAA